MIKESGAQFAGPAAEHSDGWSNWASSCNEWNAAQLGPKLDLVRLILDAIRRQGLKTMVSMHHQYSVNGDYFIDVPPQQDEGLRRLFYQNSWEDNRQKFLCSGLLFWTLSDSYGVHNWSLIDHALWRKPIYHALKQAQAPQALAICGWDVQINDGRAAWREHWAKEPGKLSVWGMNDALTDTSAKLKWTLLTKDGTVLAEQTQDVLLPADRSIQLADLSLANIPFSPQETVFRARLYGQDGLINETHYFLAPLQEMAKQHANITLTSKKISTNEYEITLVSDAFVWMLHMREPKGTFYTENDFDLWPGEAKTIRVSTTQPDFRPEYVWMKET